MTLQQKIQSFLDQNSIATVLISRERQEELTNIYAEVTGKIVNCASCGDSIQTALAELSVFVKRENLKPFQNQYHNKMYKLKKNALVFCKAHHRHYNWESITDEAAKLILAENPVNIAHFDSVPLEVDSVADVKSELQDPETATVVVEKSIASTPKNISQGKRNRNRK